MAVEITLEKIELVKDRTGVSYKEAKDALEAAEGNVVDAIIAIEEDINLTGSNKAREQAVQVVEKIKDYVKKGNVSRIMIKKENEVLLNLPVTAGIVGAVIAPWAAIVGVIVAFGSKCTIELMKEDGTIVDVSEKATDKFGDAAAAGADLAGSIKDKSSDVYDSVKTKAQDVFTPSEDKPSMKSEGLKDTLDEMWEAAKKRVDQTDDGETEEGLDETLKTAEAAADAAANDAAGKKDEEKDPAGPF